MNFKDIVRVWGVADSFALNYKKGTDGLWRAQVPADLDDGTYAVDIFAENRIGKVAHWTGFLYMRQGAACMHLNNKLYVFWLGVTAYNMHGGAVTQAVADVARYALHGGTSTEINYVRSCRHCRTF